MCGVFGTVGSYSHQEWKLAHDLLVALAVVSERRGTDAAGYAALTTRGRLLWQKQPVPARELFQGKEFANLRRRNIQMVICHTRLATHGKAEKNVNNHPHLTGDWVLVTNGVIPAHCEKAAALRLPLTSRCDSEILVQALYRYGERAGPDVCLSLGGKQSVLAINTKTRRLLAWTNGEMPLVAFRVKGWSALWWASTEEIAREALAAVRLRARFATVKPERVYQMEVREGQVVMESRPAQSRR